MANLKHILIIGAGPAGIQAALAACSAGCRVTLISDAPPGGRAAWQTLLPSKMWLESIPNFDLVRLRTRYERVAGAWQRQILEELERAGVDFRLGTAAFLSPHQIQVTPPEGGYPDQISADSVIIAAGAVPFLPPGLEPDADRVFSPHQIWKISTLPRDMVVIGAGGPATEYVDAFSRLGVKITWITGPVGVLSAFPPDAGQFISRVMEGRGVRIISGLLARKIEREKQMVRVETADGAQHEAEMAFIAIGMRPDLDRLNLPAAGLKAGSSGGLAADSYGRTSVPNIYLAGDAASPLSANISAAQGRIAGLHAAGKNVEPFHPEDAVMAIYTDPQVVMVGRMSDRTQPLVRIRVPFKACLKAHLYLEPAASSDQEGVQTGSDGFLEIASDPARRIVGAMAVCPEAAEVITPLAVAIRAGLTLDDLAQTYPAHPTFSELAIIAARLARS